MRLSILTLLAFVGGSLSADAGIIYSNDFENNTAGFNTTNTVSEVSLGGGMSTYLGPIGEGQSTVLSLTGLNANATYSVGFDLLLRGTWDGEGGNFFGFDRFRLSTAGNPDLVNATFSNFLTHQSLPVDSQSYSDATPLGGGPFTGQTDAEAGVNGSLSIYRFGGGAGNPTLTFTATGSTADLVFFNGANSSDEVFAIDNVTVSAVPEPSAFVLTAVAGGVFFVLYRKRKMLHPA